MMHRAAVKMDKTLLKNRVVAVVTFGDGGQLATKEKPIYNSPVGQIPVWPAELDGKIKFNCVPGDPVSCRCCKERKYKSLMFTRYARLAKVVVSPRIYLMASANIVTTAQSLSRNCGRK